MPSTPPPKQPGLRIFFLGTGTSTGVPQLGCRCAVCCSADKRDNRLRSSLFVCTTEGKNLLFDCGPDFRQQMCRLLHAHPGLLQPADLTKMPLPPGTDVQAVRRELAEQPPMALMPIHRLFLTHKHFDHVAGLDDLRPFAVFGDVDIYAEADVLDDLRQRIPYCFAEQKYPGVPALQLHAIAPYEHVEAGSLRVTPLRVWHGRMPILGYRFGQAAYITDVKRMDDFDLQQLRGVHTLIVGALRFRPHHSHQTIGEAIAMAEQIGAREVYLTHLSHGAGLYADSAARLPAHVHFAYDGLELQVDEAS